jgi:hypothetical protein
MENEGSLGPVNLAMAHCKLDFEHSSLYWNVSYSTAETHSGSSMTTSLGLISSVVESQLHPNAAFQELREMVLNSVASERSKRNYAKALRHHGN